MCFRKPQDGGGLELRIGLFLGFGFRVLGFGVNVPDLKVSRLISRRFTMWIEDPVGFQATSALRALRHVLSAAIFNLMEWETKK